MQVEPNPGSAAAIRAVIAEDEPLLARTLERMLAQCWPELQVVARAGDGVAATEAALRLLPEVMFLDIQMPGADGLEVAAAVADDWPEDRPLPLLVIVTAYDRYAVEAFERAAVDYLLKPVAQERLAAAVGRLRERLGQPAARGAAARLLDTVQAAARSSRGDNPTGRPAERIRVIRAGQGNKVRLIPLADVVCFEATDKYVNVVTEDTEAVVRLSLRELAERIDGVEFVRVHRGLMVNAERIEGAERDEIGHYWLSVRGAKRPLKVSRAFSHLFRPM